MRRAVFDDDSISDSPPKQYDEFSSEGAARSDATSVQRRRCPGTTRNSTIHLLRRSVPGLATISGMLHVFFLQMYIKNRNKITTLHMPIHYAHDCDVLSLIFPWRLNVKWCYKAG